MATLLSVSCSRNKKQVYDLFSIPETCYFFAKKGAKIYAKIDSGEGPTV